MPETGLASTFQCGEDGLAFYLPGHRKWTPGSPVAPVPPTETAHLRVAERFPPFTAGVRWAFLPVEERRMAPGDPINHRFFSPSRPVHREEACSGAAYVNGGSLFNSCH